MTLTDKTTYTEGVGRRKTSTARVRIRPASKTSYTINDKELEAYFKLDQHRATVTRALSLETILGKFAVSVRVNGGGISSQAEAVSHGLARALNAHNTEFRKSLKQDGLLTRDGRMKERRKFGLKKARKAPQWRKR